MDCFEILHMAAVGPCYTSGIHIMYHFSWQLLDIYIFITQLSHIMTVTFSVGPRAPQTDVMNLRDNLLCPYSGANQLH